MKSAILFATAALLSFGGAASAATYHLTPLDTSFNGKGRTQATKNGITLPCKAKFNGNVDADGVGHITSGSFKGQIGCESVSLGNLPWTANATSRTKAVIHNVAFTTPIGSCGPGDLPVKVTAAGTIIFTEVPLAGGCTVSGKIQTTPPLGIARD